MTPAQFQLHWFNHKYNEQQGYQRHFQDLCALAAFEPPHDPELFTFEKQVTKLGGGQGRADVWLKGHFGWEYKAPGADLDQAYRQLAEYREALDNPPLLVVSDLDQVIIHTNFPDTRHVTHRFCTATVPQPTTLELLRKLFRDPGALNPQLSREAVSELAARRVADLFDDLTARGVVATDAAHYLMRVVFCLFAEGVRLLPGQLVTGLLRRRRSEPGLLSRQLATLMATMSTGGDFGPEEIRWFNGSLFDGQPGIRLELAESRALAEAATLDWAQVEPSIFGNLLEGALSKDPQRRRRLGAHYTARADIELLVEPVLTAPLRREWEALHAACEQLLAAPEGRAEVHRQLDAFKERLAAVRVLDPACGSGNFLYVALANLLDLEHAVCETGVAWGLPADWGSDRRVGPQQCYGLDCDPYAVELARVTVWIGYLQWRHEHAVVYTREPVLAPLGEQIQQRDAILDPDGSEPEWPRADVILGNPPFLGRHNRDRILQPGYAQRLYQLYEGRLSPGADLCCYWFERARAEVAAGRAGRVGLLATNSIRQPHSRGVLQRILDSGGIFLAWSDRDWRDDGAAVRVSMVGFDNGSDPGRVLDGQPVEQIHPDLTTGLDLSQARRLAANAGIAYMGITRGGPFELDSEQASTMLAAPNPDGRSNRDVVKPWVNGLDLTRRPRGKWIIDFGCSTPAAEAALYEAPFEYVKQHVKPLREANNRAAYRERWWIHIEARPALRAALAGRPRYLATVLTAKHRVFVWLDASVLPDCTVIALARSDNYCLGVLSSQPHRCWADSNSGALGDADTPRYTPTTCFETFPFPRPDEAQREAIAAAARALDELRTGALANDAKLTLTALYNKRPTWLANAHATLDAAVLAAYGWPADLPDHDLLARLLALNLERAAEEATTAS